jgi:hypothetical protein
MIPDDFLISIVDYASIARPRTTFGCGGEDAERAYSVLKRHDFEK